MTDANAILSAMTISERRLKHTLGVAEAAKEIAKTHFPALDLKQVELAALMHDFTKEYPYERQLELCAKYSIELTDEERNNPKLLHAKTAAMIASERFSLSTDICNAIYWHTTGKPAMSPLEIVIYLADYIEEDGDVHEESPVAVGLPQPTRSGRRYQTPQPRILSPAVLPQRAVGLHPG